VGIRTVFNVLGPLTNPASAQAQVLGVFDASLVVPLADVLRHLGIKNAMVVHGVGGLDEVSTFGPTIVCEVRHGELLPYEIDPADIGLIRASPADLSGGDAAENAILARRLLDGLERGPKRDIVIANAACGIYVGGVASTLRGAAEAAADAIDSGKALAVLEAYVSRSRDAAVSGETEA
jgi:anthranilate phosphoribosyltransferase